MRGGRKETEALTARQGLTWISNMTANLDEEMLAMLDVDKTRGKQGIVALGAP